MRCVSIVGARPQFIKAAVVSKALRQHHQEKIIHTGQHYDYSMSEQFFEELTLPTPDYHLHCGSASHGAQTGCMLERIEQVLLQEPCDWVIVYGDTNSTLAGALAAAKLHIPVAHVEAGLRSFNRAMPEEINRVVTDHLSTRLFCPTEVACHNLLQEGIVQGVEQVGDVMYDLLLQMLPVLDERGGALLRHYELVPQSYVLVTVHRAANTDDANALRSIAEALNRLTLPVIFPLHPRTRERLKQYDIVWQSHVRFIEPVGYLAMLALERYAYRILTDSGGVQKEAFFLQVPCITLREETEWPETLVDGWNTLVGTRWPDILSAVEQPQPCWTQGHPFGDGKAAQRIAHSLQDAG
jgi:UDP-GlcNAc3NAcA epimerase